MFQPTAGSIAPRAIFTSIPGALSRAQSSPTRIPTTRASVRMFMSAIATRPDPAQAPRRGHDRDGDLRPDPDAQRGRAFVSSRRPHARLGAGSRGLERRDLGRVRDYKLESDGVSPAFEPLRCHAFITESTFGLPIYRWRPQAETFAAIDLWRRENIATGRASILFAYRSARRSGCWPMST